MVFRRNENSTSTPGMNEIKCRRDKNPFFKLKYVPSCANEKYRREREKAKKEEEEEEEGRKNVLHLRVRVHAYTCTRKRKSIRCRHFHITLYAGAFLILIRPENFNGEIFNAGCNVMKIIKIQCKTGLSYRIMQTPRRVVPGYSETKHASPVQCVIIWNLRRYSRER